MPILNAEAYLSQALASIQCQTFSDWELLIWDDGSSDRSVEIAMASARLDVRIKLLGSGKKGLPVALNHLLCYAQGQFIARMDADDICFPCRFDLQYELLSSDPAIGLVGGQAITIDSKGKQIGTWQVVTGHSEIDLDHINGWRVQIIHPTAMMRSELLSRVGGYNVQSPVEDLDLWLRLAEVSQLVNLRQHVICYRVMSTSYSQSDPTLRAQQFTEAALAARRRRGLPADSLPPPFWIDSTPRDHFSQSIKKAMSHVSSGHRDLALWQSLRCLLQRPWSKRAWRLLVYSIPRLGLRP